MQGWPGTRPRLTGLILAGGASRRMGRDKAQLLWRGRPLIRGVYEAIVPWCERVWVVTSRSAAYTPLLPSTCGFWSEAPPPNWLPEDPPPGPLWAFSQALTIVETPWVVLMACDLPHVTPDLVQSWLTYLPQDSRNPARAYLPKHPQGWWEPLCGFYDRRCEASLNKFYQRGGRSFQAWLRQETVQPLPLDNPQQVANWNTPEDWDLGGV